MLTGLLLSCPARFIIQPGPKNVPWDGAIPIELGPPISLNYQENDSLDTLIGQPAGDNPSSELLSSQICQSGSHNLLSPKDGQTSEGRWDFIGLAGIWTFFLDRHKQLRNCLISSPSPAFCSPCFSARSRPQR